MERLSSAWTWWHKTAFPRLWFGFLGLSALVLIPAVVQQRVPPETLLIPVGMAAFGYALMRWLRVFALADEVWLDGDQVVVRDRGDEDRFPLSRIDRVSATVLTNPERITLSLREPCRFGREVVFVPP